MSSEIEPGIGWARGGAGAGSVEQYEDDVVAHLSLRLLSMAKGWAGARIERFLNADGELDT